MKTAVGLTQAAPESACEQAVAPRARQRKRGATKEKDPAAIAAGNGNNRATAAAVVQTASEALAVAEPTRRPRRRYHRVVVGGEVEISDGFVRRWAETTDEWGRPIRVRLTDEDGFPASEWVETGRRLSNGQTVVRFPVDEFPETPRFTMGKGGQVVLLPPLTPRGTKPNLPTEWFRPVPKGHPGREAFEAKRKEWFAGLPEGPEPTEAPEPQPAPEPAEQWFVVTLPGVAMQNSFWGVEHGWDDYIPPDARENFPEGWCCRLAQPQPTNWLVTDYDYEGRPRSGRVDVDPDWVYVQLPVHYWVLDAATGQWWRRTDQPRGHGRGGNDRRVRCGMWVPQWCLKPVTPAEARLVYDWLVGEYRRALAEAGW
jgi:hypothetical protein